jgi:hypothetical protein
LKPITSKETAKKARETLREMRLAAAWSAYAAAYAAAWSADAAADAAAYAADAAYADASSAPTRRHEVMDGPVGIKLRAATLECLDALIKVTL